jgi:predicted MFS family arabinose efflux permease
LYNRAVVLGAYLACFDLRLAIAGPFAGGVAEAVGLSAVFVAAAAAVLIAIVVTVAARDLLPVFMPLIS